MCCQLHANIRAALPAPPALNDSRRALNHSCGYLKAVQLYNMIYSSQEIGANELPRVKPPITGKHSKWIYERTFFHHKV